MEPKIIYSLSTHPLIHDRWYMGNRLKETIYMTALSMLYSHLWYRDIELYVDETAYRFLYMLPCRVTLMELDHHKELWMKPKIKAMEQQTGPFVHLDTDVFIKRKIDLCFPRILLERREGGYRLHYKQQIDFFNQYTQELPYWHQDLGRTYSCGVLGFRDMELCADFINAYYQLERRFLINRDAYAPLKQQGFEPCIVIEQYNLASLLNYKNVRPTLLLKGRNFKEQVKEAKELGYSHLFGLKKYREHIVKEIEYRLYKIFPYWYAQVKLALEAHGLQDDSGGKKQSRVA